jgi:L-asparaginase II
MASPDIGIGIDGCGVPVFRLPLANMAWSYARLAHAATHGDTPSQRIVAAMTGHPFLVGGTDRFDTVLMQGCRGNVIAKIGAEGVHTLAIVDRGIGLAVKVEDGAARAQYPAVLALLGAMGALPEPLPDALATWAQRTVPNTRGETVGAILVDAGAVGDALVLGSPRSAT